MIKLFRLLQQLSPAEIGDLERYLSSPYFVQSEVPLAVFSAVIRHHPDYEKVQKEAIAKSVFPTRAYNSKFINQRFSELSRHIEAFLSMQAFQRDQQLQQTAQRKALLRPGLYKDFKKVCHKQLASLGNANTFSAEDFWAAYQINCDLYDHPSRIAHDTGHNEFDDLQAHLDRFVIYEKLKVFCDFYSQKQTYHREKQLVLEQAIMKEAKALKKDYPPIELFYELTLLFQKGFPDKDTEKVYKLFIKKGDLLNREDQTLIMQKLVTVLNVKQQKKGQKFIRLLFQLYQFGDTHQLLVHHKQITDSTYFNICTVAAHLKEVSWAEDFIQRYRPYLAPQSQEHAVNLAKAIVLFHQHYFDKAYELIQEIPKKGIHYNWRLRTLHVRCVLGSYIEDPFKRQLKPTLDGINAFRQYLIRDTSISPARKKQYLTFCKMAKKMADIRLYEWRNRQTKQALLQEINNEPAIFLKSWLIQILQEGGKHQPI